MVYIVKSPVEGYKGSSAGVEFVNGIGKTDDPRVAEWLEKKGYSVTKEKTGRDKKKGEDLLEDAPVEPVNSDSGGVSG